MNVTVWPMLETAPAWSVERTVSKTALLFAVAYNVPVSCITAAANKILPTILK